MDTIITFGVMIGLCQIVKAVFYAFSMWKAHDFAYTSLAQIRLNMIKHLKKLSLKFFFKKER